MESIVNPAPEFFLLSASLMLTAFLVAWYVLQRTMETPYRRNPINAETGNPTGEDWKALGLLLFIALLQALYFTFRFWGHWSESDTATLTQVMESIVQQGSIYNSRWQYQHGFGYQSFVIALQAAVRLPLADLQTKVLPVVAAMLFSSSSYILFSRSTRNRWVAMLGSMLLMLQPDIQFVLFRGSHEKIVWPMMMLALAFLFGSIGQSVGRKIPMVIGFYASLFAILLTNVFFGSVFLAAIAISLMIGVLFIQIFRKRAPLDFTEVSRLMYISMAGFILIAIVLFYLYPPAFHNIRNSQSIIEQLGILLLTFEPAAEPYAYMGTGWVSPYTYPALTLFTWILLGTSFLVWIKRGYEYVTGRARQGLAENLDWFLYTGFGIQMAVSVLVDLAGALSSNMQLRIAPGFSILAAMLVVRYLQRNLRIIQLRKTGWHRIIPVAGGIAAVWFALAAGLKSTNDPFVSNKWGFYSTAEKEAVGWIDRHVRESRVWSGTEDRLATMFRMLYIAESGSGNKYVHGNYRAEYTFVLETDIDKIWQARMEISALPVGAWDLIFDNGEARLYRMPHFIRWEP